MKIKKKINDLQNTSSKSDACTSRTAYDCNHRFFRYMNGSLDNPSYVH